jgi:hypothetical protein
MLMGNLSGETRHALQLPWIIPVIHHTVPALALPRAVVSVKRHDPEIMDNCCYPSIRAIIGPWIRRRGV